MIKLFVGRLKMVSQIIIGQDIK